MNSRKLVRVAAGGLLALGVCGAACAAGPVQEVAMAQDEAPLDLKTLDLIVTGSSWTSDDVGSIAKALHADGYMLVRSSRGPAVVQYAASMMALGDRYGEIALIGETLQPGIYWNFSKESAFVSFGEGEAKVEVVEIPAGRMIIVGDGVVVSSENPLLSSMGLNTLGGVVQDIAGLQTCDTGYYACCQFNNGGNTISGECVENGKKPSNGGKCSFGGPGSSACAITP